MRTVVEVKTSKGTSPMKTCGARITQEIIDNACRNSQNRCMVADAIQAKYPRAKCIWVDATSIRFTLDKVRYWFMPPQNVKNLITRFDDIGAKGVAPFSFCSTIRISARPSGFWSTHKADNRTNASKRYDPSKKKRKYAPLVRVHGVCVTAVA